ncbi:bcl-2-modifying factor-like [Conger conger]|uniref:bcl-2-modifying factor-like n=1 Tax=Conger conger TaxID=82655 RepID=UPI002A5A7D50|nr:bcl-2-modifying factor-like [Conger conger]
MDDDEDDVFQHSLLMWNTPFREIKYEDRGTQTPSPPLGQDDMMLPCGVAHEPRRLFYGNAGFRLHFPARFEHGGDQEEEEEGLGAAERPEDLPAALSAEVQIGQKLQVIGDQFHQDHLHLYRRNQRNRRPAWWRLAIALYTFLFEREGVVRRRQADQRGCVLKFPR